MAIDLATLLDFLEQETGLDPADIEHNTPLFSTGMVDSFALVTLMIHLETLGNFRINPADVTLDNLDTIGRILAYVESKSV